MYRIPVVVLPPYMLRAAKEGSGTIEPVVRSAEMNRLKRKPDSLASIPSSNL